jgi:glycine dehydrogenase subunit 2
LPEIAEVDLVRHYTELSRYVYGVDNGFYPLGSCTMKYNPKMNEEIARLPGFCDLHPLQDMRSAQGALTVMAQLEDALCEIAGMDAFSLQPAAGAQGEWTALRMIRAYHLKNGDINRDCVLVADSAHGTNPASAAMAGFKVKSVPSGPDERLDLQALSRLAGRDTAALMLTNPNTLGIFEKDIAAIGEIIHQAGGLLYYDGANLNAVMGICRPGDMGFDAVHLNLHKTFSTPHGGGGPGSGPVGCKQFLAPYLPAPRVVGGPDGYDLSQDFPDSIGPVKNFYGNFLVCLRAYAYILALGGDGIKKASLNAVLNANYMLFALQKYSSLRYDGPCMHEFVLSLKDLKEETGVSALDVAKALIDFEIHPPTMYFPLIVPEALMVEPTETESRETLDDAIEAFIRIFDTAKKDPDSLHAAPKAAPLRRLDEVQAARKPQLRHRF